MDSNNENATISYLLSGTHKVLPSSYLKLRSYLNVYSSNIAEYHRLKLPKSLTNKIITCPFCYTPWDQNVASFKLFPSPKKRKNKLSDPQNETEGSTYHRNKLVLKCKVCTKKSSFSLIKKKNLVKEVQKLSTENPEKKMKKKKKNKCSNSGLKICYIESTKILSSSGPKNEKKSLECSSKFVTGKKKYTQNLETPKKAVKNQTNFITGTTRNKGPTKKNVKKQLSLTSRVLMKQNNAVKKNKKRFQHLKKAISQERTTTKDTLKNFLTLVEGVNKK